ncbi:MULTISPECIES: FAD-dependent 5-carboxymethylaminomethyl-2-thiouridine(34) oxidoreductase MnmC [unclassified Acinetobacter]|uniref:FAD-dependent 5-carboxymethylaminomethyl-2-thiouridine(34) oxidoreductase MnmC n=1 Tax=unclassified Acinetobacter TaxID=196816 RepID=UPI002934BEAA|nr:MULTISPECIES: FAD-dependent 5-carboxymethylaminomethyl-2-thiouridine(34) oxidoreductase MnmC [unclassified Acinetobacter]WOE30456.1 FAD-dependent 5-carboxymethylaminomethyl-2-thiouridine(34) oxidoreductase MnmC [Acinetobacter sp. SAAs470]WOE38647.1 FAD-dependent 5-carboxymethylaminomethyl-2-thiouridine(34) oxidoreductase MnmC [Acinetobacter sp. SAAs474]
MSDIIQTADLDWQIVDGIEVPISKQFGDVYFSKDNGLLETRHVFLNGNDLTYRLANLEPFQYFTVGETGFGTGLNILALWQLWQQVRPENQSHLHVVSVEKFPLTQQDLQRALHAWPELHTFAQQLLQYYPQPLAGCHRLNFPQERFSLDLWFGDAHDVFPMMEKTHPINAWFLDGFAPSCNPDLWEEHILSNIVRLSDYGTTYASFSVAGVLKRGLQQHGINISRPRGFGHKREMLKAIWQAPDAVPSSYKEKSCDKKFNSQRQIAIIGAGIAGLSCAWALAQRGHEVVIYDKQEPLAGASGNPLALLNPKLCPATQCAEHLMTLAWQYAIPYYRQFNAFRKIDISQLALKNAEDLLCLAEQYPQSLLQRQTAEQSTLTTAYHSLKLTDAGVISPHQFAQQVLQHRQITYQHAEIKSIKQKQRVEVCTTQEQHIEYDQVIICAARHSVQLSQYYPVLKPIRGQVSWLNHSHQSLDQAYSYGGYCMQLNPEQLILGASFYPHRDDEAVLLEDHQHNFALLHSVFPQYANTLAPPETWQGRASIRTQTPDYFPLLGQLQADEEIYTFTGLGSKGFLFAPLCSEVLMALMLGEVCPIPRSLLQKLAATRFQKKIKAKKPYYQPPITT